MAEQTGIQLIDAAVRGDVVELHRLLLAGGDVNIRDTSKNTALHWAALRRQVKAIEVLLDSGADIEARNEVLETPLISGSADPEVVRILVNRGADIAAKDDRGYTPLMAAVDEYTATESVKILVAVWK